MYNYVHKLVHCCFIDADAEVNSKLLLLADLQFFH